MSCSSHSTESAQIQDMVEPQDAAMSQGMGVHEQGEDDSEMLKDCHSEALLSDDVNDAEMHETALDAEWDALEAGFYAAPTVEMDSHAQLGLMTAASVTAFLSPGTAVFLGKKRSHGIVMNLAISVSLLLISGLSAEIGFFPVPLYVTLFVLIVVFWGIGFVHTFACKLLDVRPIEPWIQFSLAILTFWLPFGFAFYVVSDFIFQRTWMSNDTMMPGMMRGDLILVDRHAFWFDEPDYGELVFIEEEVLENDIIRRRAFFGRVIAKPHDQVQLHGVQPSVNGKSLTQLHNQAENSVYERAILTYELPHLMELNENMDEPAKWYPILAPNQLLFSQTNTITLEEDYYYVLEDNREVRRDRVRSTYGSIVHQSEIKGQPRYVIYNTQDEQPFERYGLHLR